MYQTRELFAQVQLEISLIIVAVLCLYYINVYALQN